MNQTHDTTEAPRPEPGPQLNRDSIRTLDQLRRSRDDRYVAGVAGGLGRHFGIDPTIVRVLLIALTIVGGAGLLVYAAVWLLVPEDGEAHAVIPAGDEIVKIALMVAVVIAIFSTVGSSWWWGGRGLFWPAIAAVVLAVVIGAYRGNHPPKEPTAQAGTVGFTTPATSPGTTTYDAPPAGPAPRPVSPPPAPRPRRTGLVLFWPTLALILIGFGVLGIYANNHHVIASSWPALALTIIGAMLAVGAFVGRPGGLIILGLLTIPPLLITSVAENFHWENHTVNYTPTSVIAVQDSYHVGNGRMVIDLSRVSDPAQLAGREITADMNIGRLTVYLPRGVATDVTGSLDVAGDVQIGGRDQSGFDPSLSHAFNTGAPSGVLTLNVHGRIGQIEVQTR